MEFRYVVIYDYKDRQRVCKLPNIPILSISVKVCRGDEVVSFVMSNNQIYTFDAIEPRSVRRNNYVDGNYVVQGQREIKAWIGFEPDPRTTASYERLKVFKGRRPYGNV